MTEPYRHTVRIRYGEVDMQQVVFNAHYMAYCDDAVDTWFRTLVGHFEATGWEMMLKKATIEWQSGATLGDHLDIDLGVTRWGNTSFDVGFRGTVEGRPIFTASIVYVGVATGTKDTLPAPESIREALGTVDSLG